MPNLRFTLLLVNIASFVIITSFVLLAIHVVSHNKKYQSYLIQLVKYTGWCFAALFVLYFMSRLIRF